MAMEVSVYKTHFEVEHGWTMNVEDMLNRIKDEQHNKHLDVISKLRNLPTDDQEKELKKILPLICWSGTFLKRTDKDCIKHSGLICLDFDDESFDSIMQKKEFIYAAFISPTGTGVKVLVRIPENIKDHGDYYLSLSDYFGLPTIDEKCKNISRGCYLSYDPNLYHNTDAPIFYKLLPKKEVKYEKQQARNPYYVNSDDKIIDRLLKQHSNEFTQGNRNNAAYILACEFNRFGISESLAIVNMLQFVGDGFSELEVRRTIQSAYQANASEFKTKSFTDSSIVNKVENLIRHNYSYDEILDTLAKDDQLPNDIGDEALKAAQAKINASLFWKKNKLGHVLIDNDILTKWYTDNKIFRYMINEKDWIMIKDNKCHISEISLAQIKGYLREYFKANEQNCDDYVKSQIMKKLNKEYLKDDMLEWIKPQEINWLRDKRDTAYFFYQNTWIEIDAQGVRCIEANDKVGGFIWQDQIINRDFKLIGNTDSFGSSEFALFIWNIITGVSTNKFQTLPDETKPALEERFFHMCRTIGYILHNFKDPANPRAVILTDEVISDNPEGGVGKGVFLKGLSKIKNMVTMDGKSFNSSKSFLWQRVNLSTQIIALEDVMRYFDFEKQFSMITEGIEVEKKNKDSFYIPYEESPKLLITSNYVIQGTGASHERRRIEVELKQYYKPDYSPRDEFGHNLYDDWSPEEWNLFDNFMMWCVQQYLLHGVAKPVNKNLSLKKLKNAVPDTFIEWFKLKEFEHGIYHELGAVANEFRAIDHDCAKVTNRKISSWIKHYCDYWKFEYCSKTTRTGAQFIINPPKA
jgi:hypothetical protein